jgi:5-enolpyruvylshikimate-3-phosphate synthase
MAFAIGASRAVAPVTILDTVNVATSYPDFVIHAQKIGLDVRVAVDE